MARRHEAGEEGFVLIVVLLALGLLSLIVLTLSSVARLEAKTKSNIKLQAQAEVLADGLVRLVAADIAATRKFALRGLPLASGRPQGCTLGGDVVVATVTDIAGLVDLNGAPFSVLRRLLGVAGLAPGRAGVVAAAIADFRDADDTAADKGSERQAYAAAAMGHGPKNSPFESVGELDQVLGMTPELFARLKPLLTVHSHSRKVAFDVAPRAVIAALSDDDPEAVRAEARALRARADDTSTEIEAQRLGPSTFDVRVMVMHSSRSIAVRHAVFELDPGSPTGFAFREWEKARPTNAEGGSSRGAGLPACFGL